jgi:hypothetical protein
MKFFAENRPPVMREHIMNEFGLSSTHKLLITNSETEFGTVLVNTIKIEDNQWEGYYFEEVPIRIKALPAPGYKFAYWTGTIEPTSADFKIYMMTDQALTPHFEPGDINGTSLVINEISYNSADDRDAEDWIEIYNPNETTIDISGWELKDDNDTHSFVFPGSTFMYGGDFMVVTRDRSAFQEIYPFVTNVVGNFDFGLSSTDDAVRLYDSLGVLIDEVYYSSNSPWPSEPNGNGPSLELLDPFLDNALPENWDAVNPYGSPGAPNITITSVGDKIAQQEDVLEVFPNPVQDKINLKLNIQTRARIRITLYNLTGNELCRLFEGVVTPGKFTLTDVVDNLSTGIYLIRLESNNAPPVTKKVLKASQ